MIMKLCNLCILILLIDNNFVLCKIHDKSVGIFESNDIDGADDLERRGQQRINLSFPGTYWCGPGNTADNYEQLGIFNGTDKCCRDHDHCDNMPAFTTKNGLTNYDLFTRLNCKCDYEFRKCLKKENNFISNRIGQTYFSLRNKCYKEDSPIVKCEKYESRLYTMRCIQYRYDKTKPKRYQWFDLPFYTDNVEELSDDYFYN